MAEIDALADDFDPRKGKILADLMAALFKAMKDGGRVRTVQQQPELPLAVPADEAGMRQLEERLMQLFLAGLSGGSAEAIYPIPGDPKPERSPVDLDLLEDLTGRLFPVVDPVDETYAPALRDRIAGVVALLAMINNVQASGKDTGATVRLTAALATPVVVGSEEIHVAHVPWAQRKNELIKRKTAVERALNISILRGENSRLEQALQYDLYSKKGLGMKIELIVGAYENAVEEFTKDPHHLAQWKNALLKNLQFYFNAIGNEVILAAANDALDSLAAALQSATSVAQFTSAINDFEKAAREKVQTRLAAK